MGDRLLGKVCIVTGAAQGIGAAYVRAMAEEGADVAIIDLKRIDQATTVEEDISALGRRSLAIKADVTDADEHDRHGQAGGRRARPGRLPREQRRAHVRPAHRHVGTTSSR